MARDEWKNARLREFRRTEAELRTLLNEWDPIGGAPADEYDCLIPPLYARLRAGASSHDIELLVSRELEHHFGLDPVPERDRQFAERVVRWAETQRLPDTPASRPV